MSGIIGSKFNIRGSGLVGSLGTDGQHMLSSGAGVSNVFETVAGGADYVKLGEVTGDASDTSIEVDGYFTSTYQTYFIYFSNLASSDGTYLWCRYNASGTAITATNYRSVNGYAFWNSSGTGDQSAYGKWSHAAAQISNDQNATSANAMNGYLYIIDPLNTSYRKVTQGALFGYNGGDSYIWDMRFGFTYTTTPAVSGYTFYWSGGGNFVNETDWRIYGLK